MSYGNFQRSSVLLAISLLLPLLASGVLYADQRPSTDVAELWDQGCTQIVRGDFSAADATLRRLMEAEPTDAGAQRVARWLEAFQKIQEERAACQAQEYDVFVQRAKHFLDKHLSQDDEVKDDQEKDEKPPAEKLSEVAEDAEVPDEADEDYKAPTHLDRALANLRRAYWNADDAEAFREEAWVEELAGVAEAEADALLKEKDWLEARNIYVSLNSVFENSKEYEKKAKKCQNHWRLEALYSPKREWRESLNGIEPSIAEDTIQRVARDYFKEPDFKKMGVSAFENLQSLAESEAIAEVFESLGDPERREMFQGRVDAHIEQLKRKKHVSRRDLRKHFQRLLDINRQTLQLPDELIIKEFAEGALSSFDQFTTMIWPSEFKEFHKHTVGQFIGVGIQIQKSVSDEILVVSPLPDTSAYRAGIQAGDIITHIEGQSTQGMKLTKAVDLITGPADTMVTLTARRETGGHVEELEYPLKRTLVEIKTVRGFQRMKDDPAQWDYMIDKELKVAYVRVDTFTERTAENLRAALNLLVDQGMRGLILDLRFNPGGLLRSAVDVSDVFLRQNELIVKTEGRSSAPWPIRARGKEKLPEFPLIVLVNDYSASASEIVAGAIKSHERGLVMGERTFGKGSVQSLLQVGNGDARLKLTTAEYYLPDGTCLHRREDSTTWGVEPDVSVKLYPRELAAVLIMRRQEDVIHRAGEEEKAADDSAEDAPPTDEADQADGADADEKPADADNEEEDQIGELPERPTDLDPQLESAKLVMRVKLFSGTDWMLHAQAKAETAHIQ